MKRILVSLTALALCAVNALAWEPVWFEGTCATGALTTITVPRVTGKVVYAAIANLTTSTGQTNQCAISTTANTGATVGSARTIVASTNVTTWGPFAPNTYLYKDTVVMTVTNVGTNVDTTSIKGVLVLEKYD